MRYSQLTPPLVAIAHGSRDPRAGAAVSDLLSVLRDRAAQRGLAGLDARAAFLGHAPPAPAQVLGALASEAGGSGGSPPRPGIAGEAGRAAGVSPPSQRRAGGSGGSPPRPGIAGEAGRAAGVSPPSQRRAGGSGGSPPRVNTVVLPLLLTAAYHSDTDIPGLLAAAPGCWPALSISYGQPLGPDPALLRALDRRLAEAGADLAQAPRTAVVLAAAGSSQPAANAVIARMAVDWQAARGWQAVQPAYASAASPTPEQAVAALRRAGAEQVLVATYLLAPGQFADRIRDTSLAAGAAAVSAPLGAAAEVADVLLDRYQAAAGQAAAPATAAPAWVSAR